MDVATEVHDETLIHRVSGRIDTSTAADAEHKLTAEVRQGRRVVLDMTRVAYVSSAGLRVVLMAAKLAKANRGPWPCSACSQRFGKSSPCPASIRW